MREKRRFRKGIALFMVFTFTVSVGMTGCGDAGTNDKEESNVGETQVGKEGDTGQSKDKVKVRMVTYLGNPQRDALIQEIVSKLDHIELEIITPPSEQANQKIDAMLQSGEAIDILEFNGINVNYVQNGFIEPLNKYVEKWNEWESVSGLLKDQLTSYDENIYSIPYGVYERALFYRKDWFEEKNLKVPETWEELYDTAKELTDPSQNRYGYSFRGGAGTTGFLQMTVLSFLKKDAIDITTPFLTRDGKSAYAQPEAIEAMEFYKKLYNDASHPDSISWGYPETVEAFYSGVTSMLIQDPEVIATCEEYMEEGTWDVALLPVGPEGEALFPAGFAGWAIASKSENKDAAWEVIQALSSVEGNSYFCKKNGNIPIHTEAQKDPFFSDGYYGCYVDMAEQPDKYIGYVDGGEERYASEEEVAILKDFGASSDSLTQSMLLGRSTPQELSDQFAEFYSWAKDSEWVKNRYQ